MMDIKQVLLKYWGFANFRPMQEDIILSAIQKNDTLALLPTGGGKSICFQVPAMAEEGMCIVISPLIALMKDQVEGLKRKGIPAAALYSGMSKEEMNLAINKARFGNLKFLYISPERLETDLILHNIQKMPVNLLAVDEAHCISQWGYDFRPTYLNIAKIRNELPQVPVLALTATATPEVVKDIQDKLEFPRENLFQKSFNRENLTYVVQKEEDKLQRLLKIIRNLGGSGVVYVRNRRKTVEISRFLASEKITADFYHGGLDTPTRSKKQDDWIQGRKQVIVATNAFGMGIDKPNVRFVVHLDIPDSIEAYFQEAGRGGRDGKTAYAALLYDNSDIMDVKENLKRQYPPMEVIRKVYHALGSFFQIPIGAGKESTSDFNLNTFCEHFNLNIFEAASSLKLLEKEGYLLLQDVFENQAHIHIKSKKEDLYKFQVENIKYDKFIKTILRSYSGLFADFVKINESTLAKRTELSEEKVIKALQYLHSLNLITYLPAKRNPQLTFITERIDGKDLYLSKETYENRLKTAQTRLDAMLDYLNNKTKCRTVQLLAYFGETWDQRCGKCDVCIERNKVEMSNFEFDQIIDKIKPLLKQKGLTMKEIAGLLPQLNEDKLIHAIQFLLDNGKIKYAENQELMWVG